MGVAAQSAARAPANAPGIDLLFGDSIAEGMRTAANTGGDCKVGRSPKDVYDALTHFPPEQISGKTVGLSSGAANNVTQIDRYLPLQIACLKQANAGKIIVIGVSARQKNLDPVAVNQKIRMIAIGLGCVFGGPISNPGPDGVHPNGVAGYRELLKQMMQAASAPVKKPVFTPTPKPKPGL